MATCDLGYGDTLTCAAKVKVRRWAAVTEVRGGRGVSTGHLLFGFKVF